jgi:hypothetical protein
MAINARPYTKLPASSVKGHCQPTPFPPQFRESIPAPLLRFNPARAMVASIEQLKRDFTDKYVKVDASRPELARFGDLVGQVKTVNMSRRALVEFMDYHLNIGWYDIDLSFLTVVPKPSEEELEAKKSEKKAPEAKAAPKAEAKPAAKAAAKPAAAGGAKMSVADMLAAARGGGGGAAAKPAAPKAKADAPAKPAAKPAAGAAAPGKPMDRGKMSVADMLAAARSGGGAAAPAAKPAPAEEEAEEPAAEAAPVAKPAKAAAPKASGGRVDRSTMSVADMIAHCRSVDAS